jgi:uncharacterized protein
MTVAFVVTLAVLLGLLLFFFNEVQRPVRASKWDGSAIWRKRIRVSLLGIMLLLAGAVCWGLFIEPNRLVVRHETIQLEHWPAELSGLRIAVLSDIHAGSPFIDRDKLRLIVERTNQLQPDLIVILGDYMTGNGWVRRRMEPEVFAPELKGFRAPLGVYSVLGNHDWWYNGFHVRAALEANGIKVLEDEVIKIDTRGSSFWLVGLVDAWTREQHIDETIAKVPEGQPLIALTHNPDIFPQVPQRVPLLLAGHTHGGQVQFPLIGSVVQASEFGDRYLEGHIVENGHDLFVTTGIGTSIAAVRFGVPPEIVLLTLEAKR